jgi:hypothetical protein
MSTPYPPNLYRITSDAPINFLEIPTITLKTTAQNDSDDELRAPICWSPLDEYRGAGSLSLRRIRTLGDGTNATRHDPTYAPDRARSILYEARDAIYRILGAGHPVGQELQRLADGL